MKKFLLLGFAVLMLSARLPAQDSVSANLTDQSTACATTNSCLLATVLPSNGGASFKLSGTFNAVIQFEASADPLTVLPGDAKWVALSVSPSDGSAAVTSTTQSGSNLSLAWQANVSGFRRVRIRVSTHTSGTVAAAINLSTASAHSGGPSGSGSGTITGCTTAGGVLYENGTANTATCGATPTWNSSTSQLNVGLTSGLTNPIFTNIISQNTTSLFSGVATALAPNNYPITAVSQSTNSTTTSGIYATSVATGSMDASDYAVEADAYSAANMGVTQTMNGAIISFVQNNGPGNVTDLFSVGGQTNNLLGTTTRLSGFLAFSPFITNGTGGTVTNIYGYQAQAQNTITAATMMAAYHADDQGTNVKSFSFYSAGGQNRYLASSGQTTDVSDVVNTSTATPYGSIDVARGKVAGNIPAEGEGAVRETIQEDSSTVGEVWWNKAAPAGNSFDVNMATDGSTNLDHSTDGVEFDFLSFNADGSETANLAAGKSFGISTGLVSCGVPTSAGCVITGAGVTSGTATLTWPAVAGTTTNPIASSNNMSMPGLVLTGSAPAITATGTTPYINASGPLEQRAQCSFSLTTSTLTTAASPVNLCTLTLPNAAVVWRVNCQGGWSVTAGTTPTFAVGNNWAQTPSGVFGAGNIDTTNAGVGVQGTTSSTSNGNVVATTTLTTSATIFTTTWWTTFTGSATSGQYHPTASVTGANATGTLVGFCTIQ